MCSSQFKVFHSEIFHTYTLHLCIHVYLFSEFFETESLNFEFFKIKASMELGLQNARLFVFFLLTFYFLVAWSSVTCSILELDFDPTYSRASAIIFLAGLVGGGEDVGSHPKFGEDRVGEVWEPHRS